MQVVGQEAGNGASKVMSKGQSLIYENRLQRVYGHEIHLPGSKKDTVYEYEGESYIISNKGTTSGGRNSKRYGTKEYLIENLIAISKVMTDNKVTVVTGLPCLDYRNSNTVELVKSTLLGEHRLKIDGSLVKFTIVEVHVLPQPLGTLIDFMFGASLTITNDRDKYKYLVIDVGRGTTDILVTDGMRAEKITGIDVGCMDITNTYLDYVNGKYKDTDYLFTREDVGLNNNPIISKYEQVFDFTVELDLAKRDVAQRIATFINDSGINFNSVDRVIYTGGGAIALGDYLQFNSNTKVYTDPQLGNARGFHKFGLIKRGR